MYMKRIVMVLVVLLVATSLFAGGKECELRSGKSVELTGTLSKADGAKPVFRVANSDKSYTVCEQTKADVLKLSNTNVRVKAKVVSCGDGEELMITEAKKI
jgi:maltose-binding protein MalE